MENLWFIAKASLLQLQALVNELKSLTARISGGLIKSARQQLYVQSTLSKGTTTAPTIHIVSYENKTRHIRINQTEHTNIQIPLFLPQC